MWILLLDHDFSRFSKLRVLYCRWHSVSVQWNYGHFIRCISSSLQWKQKKKKTQRWVWAPRDEEWTDSVAISHTIYIIDEINCMFECTSLKDDEKNSQRRAKLNQHNHHHHKGINMKIIITIIVLLYAYYHKFQSHTNTSVRSLCIECHFVHRSEQWRGKRMNATATNQMAKR